MKHVFLAMIALAIGLSSCSKDDESDNDNNCEIESLTTMVVGTWKDVSDGESVSFSSDMSYVDNSNIIHSCNTGTWTAINNDAVLELICDGNFYKDVPISSFNCDTLKFKAFGVNRVLSKQ